MKHYVPALLLVFTIYPMHEKTPLLSKQQSSSCNHIQQALDFLKKIQLTETAKEIFLAFNKQKTVKTKKTVIKNYLQKFEEEVYWFKDNYVHRDKYGNISTIQVHKLDPVIALFKEYIGN